MIPKSEEIRVGINTKIKSMIKHSINLMKDTQLKELKFSAVGGSIEIDIIEILKIFLPGIYQQNRLSSVSYVSIDNKIKEENKWIYPKLEITLLKNEPLIKNEGYQGNISEEERKILETIYNKNILKRKVLKRRYLKRKNFKLKKKRWKNKKKNIFFEKKRINEFLNEINIENVIDNQDNQDKLFNELKSIENNIILEIILSNKKYLNQKQKKIYIKLYQKLKKEYYYMEEKNI